MNVSAVLGKQEVLLCGVRLPKHPVPALGAHSVLRIEVRVEVRPSSAPSIESGHRIEECPDPRNSPMTDSHLLGPCPVACDAQPHKPGESY